MAFSAPQLPSSRDSLASPMATPGKASCFRRRSCQVIDGISAIDTYPSSALQGTSSKCIDILYGILWYYSLQSIENGQANQQMHIIEVLKAPTNANATGNSHCSQSWLALHALLLRRHQVLSSEVPVEGRTCCLNTWGSSASLSDTSYCCHATPASVISLPQQARRQLQKSNPHDSHAPLHDMLSTHQLLEHVWDHPGTCQAAVQECLHSA